jgi:uncharacterized RDD family membrane protein YckC
MNNDFAPPATDVTPPEQPPSADYRLAKRDQRAAGLIIDLLVSYPLMMLLLVLTDLFGLLTLLDINLGVRGLVRLFSWLVFLFGYYLVCETAWQRTIGKLVTGTRVIDVAGGRPGALQVIGRTVIRYIPLEFITYLDRPQPAGWHDRWSSTRVITQKEAIE